MNRYRASEISQYASLFTGSFENKVELKDLIQISNDEDVKILFDSYDSSFEGLSVCHKGKFFIHIDTDSVIEPSKDRGKFTVAHELGHCLIEEHRIGLLSETLEPHISNYILGDNGSKVKSQIELEADQFASSLLMPQKLFEEATKEFKDSFSFDTLLFLSEYFETSLLATILRFAETGPKPVFFTFNRNGNVKWYKDGSSFPDRAFKFNVHGSVPKSTLIHDVFQNGLSHIGEIRKVDRDDWFYVNDDDHGSYELYEQCYHLTTYDLIVSMLWFEK